jgi:hypothetical protein
MLERSSSGIRAALAMHSAASSSATTAAARILGLSTDVCLLMAGWSRQ